MLVKGFEKVIIISGVMVICMNATKDYEASFVGADGGYRGAVICQEILLVRVRPSGIRNPCDLLFFFQACHFAWHRSLALLRVFGRNPLIPNSSRFSWFGSRWAAIPALTKVGLERARPSTPTWSQHLFTLRTIQLNPSTAPDIPYSQTLGTTLLTPS